MKTINLDAEDAHPSGFAGVPGRRQHLFSINAPFADISFRVEDIFGFRPRVALARNPGLSDRTPLGFLPGGGLGEKTTFGQWRRLV
jgi:hypothetical protein